MADRPKHLGRDDALLLILDGDQSDFSDISSDEDNDEYIASDGDDDEIPGTVAGDSSDEGSENSMDKSSAEDAATEEHAFRWRKRDIPHTPAAFDNQQEDIPDNMTPLAYSNSFG